MTRLFILTGFLLYLLPLVCAQDTLQGRILDAETREAIPGVHVVGFGDKVYGSSSNQDGDFILQRRAELDSIRISCIGYTTNVLLPADFRIGSLQILLRPFTTSLLALTVKPPSPQQLIRDAVRAMPTNYATTPYQIRGFYRERIHNDSIYFSVAEAVFESQLFPGKSEGAQLKLIQGRRSETVRSTRIFEDYHPGGGPNYLMLHTLELDLPDFLLESNFPDYVYTIDSITRYEGHDVYVIGFDQKASVKKNLSAGALYLDAESLALIEVNFKASEQGVEFRKHLTGKDNVMADLLGIEFEVLKRSTRYSYRRTGTTWSLHEAKFSMDIHFTQPRKSINERFSFQAEMLALSQTAGPLVPFAKNDVWQKNQLVKNLPGEFDEQFWGTDNYIQPETSLTAAVASMDVLHAATLPTGIPDGWMLMNNAATKVYHRDSTIMLKPYMESRWRDGEQVPFLWKKMDGDFELYARLQITQARDTSATPHAGFQLGGLMVRMEGDGPENYILFGLGCMGNPQLKLVSQNTINGNSAIYVTKVNQREIPLRLQRHGSRFALHYLSAEKNQWTLLREIRRDDLPGVLQVGIAGFAYFPGNAPNRQPNILVHAKGFRATPSSK